MMKDDVLTNDELILLKGILKDLTVRPKKEFPQLQSHGGNALGFSIPLSDMYNKIENLNKFLIEQLGD